MRRRREGVESERVEGRRRRRREKARSIVHVCTSEIASVICISRTLEAQGYFRRDWLDALHSN